MQEIWTIGHSTHPLNEFIEILKAYKIELVADVRRYPGSRKFPWFNKEELSESLKAAHIAYKHMEELGGRRNPKPDSPNTMWRNKSFKGYADYSQTPEFNEAVKKLTDVAMKKRTAYMCSEAVWWRCHRSIISDYLTFKNWKVNHIFSATKTGVHVVSPMFMQMQQTGIHFD